MPSARGRQNIYKYCFLNENGKFKDAMPVSFDQK